MTDGTSRWLLQLMKEVIKWKRRKAPIKDLFVWVENHCPKPGRKHSVMAAEPYAWVEIALRRLLERLPDIDRQMAFRLNAAFHSLPPDTDEWIVYNMIQLAGGLREWTFLQYTLKRAEQNGSIKNGRCALAARNAIGGFKM